MRKVKRRGADAVFAFLSFSVFAASMLVVLIYGANVYAKIAEKAQEGRDERLCLSYIWTKVKANDYGGGIYIEDFAGIPSLCMEEQYGGSTYKTAIYSYNGWVYELYSEAGAGLLPEDGMPVIEAVKLDFEQLDSGLIKVSVNSESMYVWPRSSFGAARGESLDGGASG